MKFSPKLKRVMSEINDLLKENDIAGVVVLHTPGFSEYLMKVNPTYSCAHLNATGVHLKTKGLDLSKDKKQELVRDTSNMFELLGKTTGQVAINLMSVSKQVDKKVNAEHSNGSHTSSESLDN